MDEQEIKEHLQAVKSRGFFPTNGSRTIVPPYLKRKKRGREVENFGPSVTPCTNNSEWSAGLGRWLCP